MDNESENDAITPEYQKHLDSGGCQCGHWQCLGCDEEYDGD